VGRRGERRRTAFWRAAQNSLNASGAKLTRACVPRTVNGTGQKRPLPAIAAAPSARSIAFGLSCERGTTLRVYETCATRRRRRHAPMHGGTSTRWRTRVSARARGLHVESVSRHAQNSSPAAARGSRKFRVPEVAIHIPPPVRPDAPGPFDTQPPGGRTAYERVLEVRRDSAAPVRGTATSPGAMRTRRRPGLPSIH